MIGLARSGAVSPRSLAPPPMRTHRRLVAIAALVIALVTFGGLAGLVRATEVVRPFTPPPFETVERGGIELIGNTLLTCQATARICAAAPGRRVLDGCVLHGRTICAAP